MGDVVRDEELPYLQRRVGSLLGGCVHVFVRCSWSPHRSLRSLLSAFHRFEGSSNVFLLTDMLEVVGQSSGGSRIFIRESFSSSAGARNHGS